MTIYGTETAVKFDIKDDKSPTLLRWWSVGHSLEVDDKAGLRYLSDAAFDHLTRSERHRR